MDLTNRRRALAGRGWYAALQYDRDSDRVSLLEKDYLQHMHIQHFPKRAFNAAHPHIFGLHHIESSHDAHS